MNDRELLEKAARACGITRSEALKKIGRPINLYSEWNPLSDDGDAFRLAQHLGLDVVFKSGYGGGASYPHSDSDSVVNCVNVYKDDPTSATRRAITRAAAVIGEHL